MRSRFPISLRSALAGAALVLAVAAPSAVAGGSGSADVPPLRSAGPFLLSEVSAKVAGNWGTVWRSLYPRHQRVAPLAAFVRSEEHTSELQSQSNLVCRLLLEKKKKRKEHIPPRHHL